MGGGKEASISTYQGRRSDTNATRSSSGPYSHIFRYIQRDRKNEQDVPTCAQRMIPLNEQVTQSKAEVVESPARGFKRSISKRSPAHIPLPLIRIVKKA